MGVNVWQGGVSRTGRGCIFYYSSLPSQSVTCPVASLFLLEIAPVLQLVQSAAARGEVVLCLAA